MIACGLGTARADEAVRVVKALGAHRYVAGRMHLVHALAFASAAPEHADVLAEGRLWAVGVVADASLDLASRDERLWRRSTDAEVAALLEAFWVPGERAKPSRERLRQLLEEHELPIGEHEPFDETAEEAIHPLLVDAGWELVSLSELDAERHRGAIAAFGHPLAFESAVFEEETAIPAAAALYELPALGPVELLRGADDDGALASTLVVWADGHPTYVDYVIRGVRRAAKLAEVDPEDEG
jgi:hypothetical protein